MHSLKNYHAPSNIGSIRTGIQNGISSEAFLQNADLRMENLPSAKRELCIEKTEVSRVLSNGVEFFQNVL